MSDRAVFSSYREFFPYYVAMHSKPLTRQLHFAGTLSGALVALVGLLTGRPKLIGALPLLGYGAAWSAHWLVEGNNPASFGHPLWSLRGDFDMIGYLLRGRDKDLSIIARDWLDAHPENRTATNWHPDRLRVAA
ncbi:Mpo1-like protein [Jatrophihabitans sp. DSM 45814]